MPRFPSIAQGALYPANGEGPIAIGTPAWSAWIREHTTFTYQDGLLFLLPRTRLLSGHRLMRISRSLSR